MTNIRCLQGMLILTMLWGLSVASAAGTITRLYPQAKRVYFHVSGDANPYAFGNYHYIDLNHHATSFGTIYKLLLLAAENHNVVNVRHVASGSATFGLVEYIYVDW